MLEKIRAWFRPAPIEQWPNNPHLGTGLGIHDLVDRLRAPVPRVSEMFTKDYVNGLREGPFDPLRLEAADRIEHLELISPASETEIMKAWKIFVKENPDGRYLSGEDFAAGYRAALRRVR